MVHHTLKYYAAKKNEVGICLRHIIKWKKKQDVEYYDDLLCVYTCTQIVFALKIFLNKISQMRKHEG